MIHKSPFLAYVNDGKESLSNNYLYILKVYTYSTHKTRETFLNWLKKMSKYNVIRSLLHGFA